MTVPQYSATWIDSVRRNGTLLRIRPPWPEVRTLPRGTAIAVPYIALYHASTRAQHYDSAGDSLLDVLELLR